MVGMKGGKEGIKAGAVESNEGLPYTADSATIRPGRVGGILSFAALLSTLTPPSHELKIAQLSHTHGTLISCTSHHCHLMYALDE